MVRRGGIRVDDGEGAYAAPAPTRTAQERAAEDLNSILCRVGDVLLPHQPLIHPPDDVLQPFDAVVRLA